MNRLKGEQVIRFADRDIVVKFNYNVLAELEDLIGMPLPMLTDNMIGIKTARALFYAGIKGGGNKGWTLEKVGNCLTMKVVEENMDALMKALNYGLTGEEEPESSGDKETGNE